MSQQVGQQRGRVRTEPCPKRIRALIGGVVVADSTRVVFVWEKPVYPAWYIPVADVRGTLVASGRIEHSPSRGDAIVCDLTIGGRTVPDAALRYDSSPLQGIAGTVRFRWEAVEEWLEEDEPVYTHPRDPYTRVDVLASSRHVRVEVDGVTVAESRASRMLFETHLPPRFYLPMSDVRTDLLEPTQTVTHCPYKGQAGYWSLVVEGRRYPDLV